MKRFTIHILSLAGLIALAACQPVNPEAYDADASRVWLRADVSEAMQTKSPYTIQYPTTDVPLLATVWATTTRFVYESLDLNGSEEDGYVVAKHTSARFQSGAIPQLLTDAIYPKNTGGGDPPPVYFVGFTPQSGSWVNEAVDESTDLGKASFVYNGNDDVMFAPEISGHYGMPLADSPTYHFYHLLTWLKIEIKADGATVQEREAVRDAWGKITTLQLKDQKSRVTIDIATLPDVSSAVQSERIANVAAKATFSGTPSVMQVYATGTDTVFPDASGYAIPTGVEPVEVAYVLCTPVLDGVTGSSGNATDYDTSDPLNPVTTNEYILEVETEHRTMIEIPVDLMTDADHFYIGNTTGRQFTITLNFKLGNTIVVSAAVRDWVNGGVGTAHFEDI